MQKLGLRKRIPIITVMGHIDHGKTTLLDAIRNTNIAEREAGGITQHIGASKVKFNDQEIIFIDTPGHELFTQLRKRGAAVTDIVILVVCAKEGVMPQTTEALNHAKAANVPIIVAINKIDLPNANPYKVQEKLSEYGLIPEEWGGDTICVKVSAKKRENIEELLEMILLLSEMLELKVDLSLPAEGVVIEAKKDKGRGNVATVILKQGILKVRDDFICGNAAGKVRMIIDCYGKSLKEVAAVDAVEILGFDTLPTSGDILKITDDVESYQRKLKEEKTFKTSFVRYTLKDLYDLTKQQKSYLNVVLKTDVWGSLEALENVINNFNQRLKDKDLELKILHKGVGAITESDIMLAEVCGGVVLGFGVDMDKIAKEYYKNSKTQVRKYKIIYDFIDDLKALIGERLEAKHKEVIEGRLIVRDIFKVKDIGTVAGCFVSEGKVYKNARCKVTRNGNILLDSEVISLKRFKEDVKEVKQGYECGVGINGLKDIKIGDVILIYRLEEIKEQL